jgi:hypothetical protein
VLVKNDTDVKCPIFIGRPLTAFVFDSDAKRPTAIGQKRSSTASALISTKETLESKIPDSCRSTIGASADVESSAHYERTDQFPRC